MWISFWNGWDAIVGVKKGNRSGFVLTEALLGIAYIDFLAKGLQSGLAGWDKRHSGTPVYKRTKEHIRFRRYL